MNSIHRLGALALGLASSAAALTFSTDAAAHHRIVASFADPTALTTTAFQARSTFAVWTTWGSGPGGVTTCPNPGDWVNCWVYWQPEPFPETVYGGLRVEPSVNSHYHLMFEDPTITCFASTSDGGGTGYGRPSGGTCIAANYAYEPRTAMAHSAGEWYYVTVEAWDNSVGSLGYPLYDLESFTNTGDDPLDLWVRWFDGNWYVLTDLGPGYVDVSWWAYSISDAQIGSDAFYANVDDIVVSEVYF